MEKVDPVFPLTIAKDLGIPIEPEKRLEFGDEMYFEYVKKYAEWAGKRDDEASKYLKDNPDAFRCFIPHNPNTYRLCGQVVWYYDQIVVSDPLNFLLDDIPEANREKFLESNKKRLRHVLRLIKVFNLPITAGYLVFVGPGVYPKLNDPPDELIEFLVQDGEIKKALYAAIRFGLKKSVTEKGHNCYIWDAQLYSGFMAGWIMEKMGPGRDTTAGYTVGEILPEASLEEISALTVHRIDKFQDIFKREISYIVKSALRGNSLSAAVLYDRELDVKTLALAGNPRIDITKNPGVIMPLNLTLPYLENVPPEMLQELRESMPDAFLDFRSNIRRIVDEAGKKDPEKAFEIAREAIISEVIPAFRSLDAEVNAAAKKAKFATLGVPVFLVFGALLGNVLGAIPSFGVALYAYKAWVDYFVKLEEIKSNPFYFLWRARRHPAEDYF